MAKAILKADFVIGTNYFYHLVDVQGTDIVIDATGSQITSTTTDFTATSTVGGITKRPIVVGDLIKISNTTNLSNEGIEVTVNTVAANAIGFTVANGTPIDEAAGADINITAFKKTFEFVEAGVLNFVDGGQAITWASKVVDDWDLGNMDIYPRIFTSIEPRAKSLACLNGWEPHNDNTLFALRDMAMEIRDTSTSAARRVYFCPRSGNLDETTDQFYMWPSSDAEMDPPVAAVTTGYINQLVLLKDTDNAIDNSGEWNFRCLEDGKTHLQYETDIQYAEIIPIPSNNSIDPKLADGTGALLVPDATVSAGGIYANVLLNVDADSLYDGDVNGSLHSYTGFVDGDTQTNENVHIKLHYLLRQGVDINNDATGPQIRGDKTPPISSFLGETLFMDEYYLLNYDTSQRNNLRLVDQTGVAQQWPSVYTLTVTGPVIAQGGTFSLIHTDTYGASSPTYLQDENGVSLQDISIAAANSIVIAFSTYNVDGHTPNTDIPLTLTWNKPGSIEPDNAAFIMSAANQTRDIGAVPDPSYVAA